VSDSASMRDICWHTHVRDQPCHQSAAVLMLVHLLMYTCSQRLANSPEFYLIRPVIQQPITYSGVCAAWFLRPGRAMLQASCAAGACVYLHSLPYQQEVSCWWRVASIQLWLQHWLSIALTSACTTDAIYLNQHHAADLHCGLHTSSRALHSE
jgi:hypothetical protein